MCLLDIGYSGNQVLPLRQTNNCLDMRCVERGPSQLPNHLQLSTETALYAETYSNIYTSIVGGDSLRTCIFYGFRIGDNCLEKKVNSCQNLLYLQKTLGLTCVSNYKLPQLSTHRPTRIYFDLI